MSSRRPSARDLRREDRAGAGLVAICRSLARAVDRLRFAAPVTHVYNPLDYARAPHEDYLRRWARRGVEAVLIGMNPGPFGMAQSGVPFGEVTLTREWLGVRGAVLRPEREHPKRPIAGFACRRSEVSGARLWGWAKSRFGAPEAFFERFFVLNYCPLVFMERSGRNLTPEKLPAIEREALEAACDRALRAALEHLRPRWAIGVGAFAENAARRALEGLDLRIGRILHPSPQSPAANRGWAPAIERELDELGIALPPGRG